MDTKYIALLRGINVGGNNKISMAELKSAYEQKGFNNVSTYINSGNILFNSNLSLQETKNACEELIKQHFGLEILVCVVSALDLMEAVENAPSWWNKDENSKHNAIFVIQPALAEEVRLSVGETKPEHEKVSYYGSVIFWSAPIRTFSKTRWSKVSQNKKIYNLITIRNANTTLKLYDLCKIALEENK